ncbi:MAG TPA: VOC family protein [Pyrinomonadaceae bacterium]|nr:VOC family protein [Pyrinomonadaceae bacterium]
MQIRFTRLNHVQLPIPTGAEERAREFYGGLLGLEEIEKPDALKPGGGMWFNVAGIQLHISIEDGQSPSKRHPAFEVKDLDEVKSYLQQNGVRLRDEVQIPNYKRLSFFDPFGNRIELLEHVDG